MRAIAAIALLAAAPQAALAQWTFNAYEGGAIASVAESDGREFGIECLETARDVMRIFVVLRPRGTIREGRTPFKFSIGRQEYSIEADLEEVAGLAKVSVGVGWSGDTQSEARGKLRAGSTVVVERQAAHQGHTFSLRGSSRALNALEEACVELWEPEPVAAPRAPRPSGAGDGRDEAGGSSKGRPRVAVAVPEPVTPDPPPEPPEAAAVPTGDWTFEADAARASVVLSGAVGDEIGLSCTRAGGGRPMWRLEVIEGGRPLPPLATFTVSSGTTEVAVEAIRLPSGGLFDAIYEAPYDLRAHIPIVREMVRRRGAVTLRAGGSVEAAFDAAGAERVVPDFFETCAGWER